MKRALIAIPVILVTLIVALLVAPNFINWEQYRDQAQAQIKATAGYDVTINGDFGVAFLPMPHAYISDASVAAPAGSLGDKLAKIKRADVYVALLPLLGGKVEFSSIKLVEPVIALQVFDDGRQNWMTPELEALTKKNPDGEAKPQGTDISFNNISIEKGAFQYAAGKGAAPIQVTDINADVSADTLKGPFKIKGDIDYNKQEISFNADIGEMVEGQPFKIKGKANVKPGDIDLEFSGVADMKEKFSAQGETSLKIASLKKIAGDKLPPALAKNDKVEIKGMMTASPDAVQFKNTEFEIAGEKMTGDLAATLSPMKIQGRFQGKDNVNLDAFIPAPDKKQKKAASFGEVLPQTMTMPMPFEADVAFSFPSATYRGETYKNIVLQLAKGDKTFAGAFKAGSIPGNGSIDAKATLVYAEKTGETYGKPSLEASLQGQSQNIPQTIKAVSGVENLAIPPSWVAGVIDGKAELVGNEIRLKDTRAKLGNTNMTINGAYAPGKDKPTITIDVAADQMDFDALQGQQKKQETASKGNLQDTLKSFNMPYDVNFDVGVQQAKLQGHTIKGLLAQGSLIGKTLKLTNLSAQDFEGSSFKVNGGVQDINALTGIDMNIAGQSSDIKAVAELAKLDTSALPKDLKSANLTAKLVGNTNALDVNAAIAAMNGKLAAKGNVSNPLGNLAINNLHIDVSHANMAQALRIFAPSAPDYVSWQKPMTFSADVKTEGKVHSLKNMKGDLAGASLSGDISLDQGGAKPSIKGDLTFGNLSMISANSAAASGAKAAGPRWSTAPIDSAWMHAFNADLSIKASTLTYETWNLQNPVLKFTVQNGTLKISQLDSDIYGGKMAVNATLVSPAGGKGALNADGAAKFTSVRIEDLVKSLAGNYIIKGSGDVNMETTIKTSGSSQASMVSNLSGKGTANGKDIVLDGFDLARFAEALSDENKPKDTLMGLYKGTIKGGSTSFNTLDGSWNIANGIVNIQKLDLTGPTAVLGTTGNVNLPNWTIATNHTVTLPQKPDVPPFTIKIAGSLDNPGQTFGEGAINDYFNRKLTRKLDSLVQDKLGDKIPEGLGGLLGLTPKAKTPAATTATTPAPAASTATPAPAPAAVTPAATPEAVAPASGADTTATPAPAAQETAPAAASTPEPAPAAEPAKAQTPEDVMKDALKGLLSQ